MNPERLYKCRCCSEMPELKIDWELSAPYSYCCCGRSTNNHKTVLDAGSEWNLCFGNEEIE